ncbi:Ig-like domain-containing protein, partial [Pantoea agglomerans]
AAEKGSVVRVYNAAGDLLGSAVALENGTWSLRLPAALPEGLNTLTVTATDAAGNVSAASSPYQLNVDTAAPVQPAILQALDGVPGGAEGDVGNGGLTNDSRPELRGAAEKGSVVRVYNAAGDLLGSAVALENGTWSLRLPAALPEGLNTLTVTATDAAGNVSAASSPYQLNV